MVYISINIKGKELIKKILSLKTISSDFKCNTFQQNEHSFKKAISIKTHSSSFNRLINNLFKYKKDHFGKSFILLLLNRNQCEKVEDFIKKINYIKL